ncbi:Trp biosynthesis-associated membrane protein [Microbacterium sp. STN6]|uniref:Trp biosynthesis-associated membrane protein n=1 Tax=Microbacterium sp. STN6 TaxID=2995588 RepID=UPI002260B2EE|nr:Trp biosynthesis-associated membrane protein [Microbacterium sp. STN6]MCX7521677.1 Trp biosynthesis-associated membrane protein [Microbacterium sp. STN6]
MSDAAVPSRRAKYAAMIAAAAASGLAVLASTQTWYTLRLVAGTARTSAVTVQGSSAAPALTALALAGLALAGALSISGRIARIVLGILGILIGASMLISSFSALADPVQAGSGAVTNATGIAGHDSVARLVTHVDTSAWPWVAVAAGVVAVLAALAVLVTGHTWPGPSRRYQAVRFESADDAAEAASHPTEAKGGAAIAGDEASAARDSAIDRWDELTRGDDPTD